jgi:hypothetical protein
MFDMSAISSAKKKAEVNQEKLVGNYDEEYQQAVKYIQEFSETFDSNILKKATEKFFNALKYKRTNIQPYFFIAYAAYLLDEIELAQKYVEFAEEIDKNFPFLEDLKELIELSYKGN